MTIDLKPLPPEQQIAFLKARGFKLTPGFSYKDIFHERHAGEFTVAKAMTVDLLADIHASLVDAQARGVPMEQWRKDLTPLLVKKGWWGKQKMVDPASGETKLVQLGSPRRLKTIFEVNMRQARAAADWAVIERQKDVKPWLVYLGGQSRKDPRKEHLAWSGTCLPVGHPWWDTHFTPNGYGCKCRVLPMSARELKAYGYTPSEEPPPSPPPRPWFNDRTGQTILVPDGIDPSFAYNPGKSAFSVQAARVLMDKMGAAPAGVGAAAQAASIAYLRPNLTADFGVWLQKLSAGDAPKGDYRIIGCLPDAVLKDWPRLFDPPQAGGIVISDKIVAHALRDVKAKRGASLSLDDLKRLPDAVLTPEATLWDEQDAALLFVITPSDGNKRGKIVVRINQALKVRDAGGQRRTVLVNEVRTAGRVMTADLKTKRYRLIEGSL